MSAPPAGAGFGGVAARLAAREGGLGLVAYVCAAPDRAANAGVDVLLLAVALAWSTLARGPAVPAGLVLVEAAGLYLGAVAIGNVLMALLGAAPVGW